MNEVWVEVVFAILCIVLVWVTVKAFKAWHHG